MSKYEKVQARLADVVTGLGEQFGQSGMSTDALGYELFSTNWMPYGHAFGTGLARGSHDPSEKWTELVELLRQSGITNFNCAVLSGFIGKREEYSKDMIERFWMNVWLIHFFAQLFSCFIRDIILTKRI